MNLIGAIGVVVLFAVLIQILDMVGRTRQVVTIAVASMRVAANAEIADDEKEKMLRNSAIRLTGLLLYLVVGGLLALIAPAALVTLLDAAGVMSSDAVFELLLSWKFIVAGTFVAIGVYFGMRQLRR